MLIQREPTGGDGGELYFNFVYSPKLDAAGATDGVLVSAVDVTESVMARRKVETMAASLRESEQRLRRVVDAAGTGTWEADVGSSVVTGDAAYRALMGLPLDGPLTIDACVEALHPADCDVAGAGPSRTRSAATTTASSRSKHRTAQPEGAPPRWIEVRGQARFGADGRAVGMAGTATDITARKKIEEAERQLLLEGARRNESDFRTLAELIPQQVWTSDSRGALDFVNERVIEYFAEPEDQILGSGWQSIIHPDDSANCLDLCRTP